MDWFEKRFGPARKANDKELADRILKDWEKGTSSACVFFCVCMLIHWIDWDVEGDPFSLISEEKKRQQKKEEEMKEKLKELEAKFMETVPEV